MWLYCHLWFLQMDLRNIPEEVVKETLEYKCLQSQFSLLYNESLGVKTQLDEARALLLTTKNAHLRQIEHMEVKPSYCFSCYLTVSLKCQFFKELKSRICVIVSALYI